VRRFIVVALILALAGGTTTPFAQQQQPATTPPEQPRFESAAGVSIVSVDVVVRDSAGNIVRGLTAKDFVVTEDGKAQRIDTFSFQEISGAGPAGAADVQLLDGLEEKVRAEAARAASATSKTPEPVAPAADVSAGVMNRRMTAILLDVSSMQPDDVQRAVEDSRKWVSESMTGADLVAIITIGTRLNVLTDFTSSKEEALAAIQTLAYNEGTEVNPEAIATAATEADAAATDTTTTEADAFQEFNNDVRLRALKTVCQELAPIQQKKALLYFSAGMSRSGNDNQIELRSATSTCNRGNVSIYAVDTRGLQAVAAGGSAASRGNGGSLLQGRGMGGFQQISQSQETLTTLAADTGGRSFTATNDFGEAFARVQRDLAAYYLLGYSSTNPLRDGKFRTIRVRVNRPDLKALNIEARPGYYAGRSFTNTNGRDREAQLDDQLQAAVSSTDVPMVVGTGYFRQQGQGGNNNDPRNDRFYVPIALAVPGFAVPVAEKATEVQLDVKGEVRDEQGRVVGRIRETMKVPSGGAETLAGRQVFYQTGLSLPPGRFVVKVVLRENTGGGIGSFEAGIVVPQMNSQAMKVSSVVMSTQVQKAGTGRTDNPLVRDGVQLLPNLTRAVGRNQKVYFYYEVYDPALAQQNPDLRTSLAFYRGGVKVFETPMVTRTAIDEPNRRAVVFQFDVPAEQFKPGAYTCQINIVDSIASMVAFPRLSFVVME
jgi:VWFA-related protein